MDRAELKKEKDVLGVYLEGSINSNNAPEIEKMILDAIGGGQVGAVRVDCGKLDYISSAGLRVLLRLRKRFPELEICEVSPEIYDIFEMTGFTEMMKITRAYRRISVEGCELIGQGANGMVFRLDPETIVKVYRDSDALDEIDRERELSRKAFVLGVPTAIPYDVVRVDDGYGSVYELLNARPFASVLGDSPERFDELMELYSGVLEKLGAARLSHGEIPRAKDRLLEGFLPARSALPAPVFDKLESMIKAASDDGTLVHGDLHIKNLMLMDDEAILIDMDTLSTGSPVFELGLIFCSYIGFNETCSEKNEKFFGLKQELLTRVWRRLIDLRFAGTSPEYKRAAEEKAMIIGYARALGHEVRKGMRDGGKTVANCVKRLCELTAKYDSLDLD